MYRYCVAENKLITPTARLVTLVQKDISKKPLSYKPGQHIAISLHDKLRPTTTRCFTLTSSPTQGNFIQFCARVKGKYTSALERLQDGDDVTVRGPFGNFVFDELANLTLFAGGIGVTPFISMLRYASDMHASNTIHLVFSCRKEEDIPFLGELQKLEQHNQNLRVTYIIGDGLIHGLEGYHVFGGSLNDETIDQLNLSYRNDTFMLCGPPQYMKIVQALLQKRGVQRTKIKTEVFSQGPSGYVSKHIHASSAVYTGVFFAFIILLGYFFIAGVVM